MRGHSMLYKNTQLNMRHFGSAESFLVKVVILDPAIHLPIISSMREKYNWRTVFKHVFACNRTESFCN